MQELEQFCLEKSIMFKLITDLHNKLLKMILLFIAE